MRRHILQLTRNIIGTVFIIIGAMGIWSAYPVPAVALLLMGICILPALYEVLPFKSKVLPVLLVVFFAVLLTVSVLIIPKDTEVKAVFKEEKKDTSVCFITPSGTRYHFSEGCAGEHAEQVKTIQATAKGYTACRICVTE